jgi:hypothetical protein
VVAISLFPSFSKNRPAPSYSLNSHPYEATICLVFSSAIEISLFSLRVIYQVKSPYTESSVILLSGSFSLSIASFADSSSIGGEG